MLLRSGGCFGSDRSECTFVALAHEPEMVVGFGLTLGKLVLSGRIDEVVDTIKTNIRHI
jgi:hypothetical protein